MKKLSKFMFVVALGVAFVASSANAYTHTVTLKMGMKSAQVMELQKALNVTPSTGYFGSITNAAVKAFQASNGLTADGVVGPMTGAKVAMGGTSSTGGSTTGGSTTGTLTGGAGSVESYELMSSLNNEEVGEGEEDVKVAGIEIEADGGSDLKLTAVKLVFNEGTAASDFEDYADEVSIWLGSSKIATVDGDEFNDDNDWTKTVSVSGNTIIKADDTEDLVVAVSGINNLDSNDAGDTWTVDFTSVRFMDAQGAVISEDPTVAVRTFSFESFATATDSELKVSLTGDEDDINEAHVIDIDDTDDTDNVEILAFTLEAEGDSDIMIDEIPVIFTSVEATGDDVDDLVTSATLYMDGEEVGSENFLSSDANDSVETITFDDLGLTIDAGEEAEFVVKVDFVSTADTLDAGDTLKAEITATERAAIDAEDESGEDLVSGDRTGTALGEASAVYHQGIMVKYVSSSATRSFEADATGEDDQGTYKVKFSVTAFDGDMYIDRSSEVAGANAAGQGVEFSVTSTAGTPVLGSNLLESSSVESEDNSNVFYVEEGKTREFTLTVIYSADSTPTDGSHSVKIESINWGTASDNTNASYYEFNLNDFKTDALFLNGIA